MSKLYKISIIGSGNVAWHLSRALEDAGHAIQEVYSQDIDNAKKLCAKLYDAFPTDDLEFAESQADIFFVCVSDDVIEQIATDIRIPEDAIIAHTSGTIPIDVFELLFPNNRGVFYPLQTFSKERKINFKEIPICIESPDKRTEKNLTEIAQSISQYVYLYDSDKRKILHLAAVFACNFTNHLLAIAKNILKKEEINYDILHALISETINKAMEYDPKEVQTGPAIRRDSKVLQEQLNFLKDDPEKKQIYKILSESILKMSKQ